MNPPPAHTFEKKTHACGRVYCAVGYALANASAIAVEGGYVAVDTLDSLVAAREVKQEFDRRIPGQVQAVVYTHSHADHIRGATLFARPGVPIWAHALFADELKYAYRFSRAYYRRAAKQFGFGLAAGLVTTNGIGPPLAMDEGPVPPTPMPTHTFETVERLQIGGVRMELHHAPGETPDQLFIWLPDDRILLAADNIYRAFPNLYAIRGARPRPVEEWIRTLDRMRYLQPAPEWLVLGHTEPVQGAARIHELLTVYRDAIAFVHDSVVRMINEGATPDELVAAIRLPPHLGDHPYLEEVYGTLAGAIRGIYSGYLGWFDGNAANLMPAEPRHLGQRLIALAGGPAGLIREIEQALEADDPQWAAWLADRLLATDPEQGAARALKAEALARLGRRTANPLCRHWYLSDAAELTGTYLLPDRAPVDGRSVAEVPIEMIMGIMPQRLHRRRAADFTGAFSFEFTDTGKCFTLLVRQGVGELVERLVDEPYLLMRTTERDFKFGLVAGEYSRRSRQFWQSFELVVPGSPLLAPVRKLRRLARFGRLLTRP